MGVRMSAAQFLAVLYGAMPYVDCHLLDGWVVRWSLGHAQMTMTPSSSSRNS
jgi:hypothetical protein